MHDIVSPDKARGRPEYERAVTDSGFGVVEKPLTFWEKIYNQAWLRKLFILFVIAVIWQSYASCMNALQFAGAWKVPATTTAGLPGLLAFPIDIALALVNWLLWVAEVIVSVPGMVMKAWTSVSTGKCQENPLLVPKFTAAIGALIEAMMPPPGAVAAAWAKGSIADTVAAIFSGELPSKMVNSVWLLLKGYATGLFLATVLTTLAILTTIGNDFLETLTAMFNPLPAIALLPLALIWFGLGDKSIIFVLVHSVLWAVALNTHSGFKSVSNTLRMVGRNYGLTGIRYVGRILIPAAFPSILTGLKIGWAFAWRTLIAAELVFGAQSGKGGLGWFIYEAKNQLEIPTVFAGLVSVILIGLLVENLIFRKLEAATIRKWGMQA
jgi:NitT/TauT family transport system permease protein